MGATLIALVAAAVAAGPSPADPGVILPSREVRWFNDEHRALTGVVPRGWYQSGAVAFAGDLAFSTAPLKRHPGDRCPGGALAPPDGAILVHILEFGVWSSGPQTDGVDGRFARGRPSARAVIRGPVVDDECFGRARRVRWREQGRAFQAHIFLDSRPSDRRLRKLAALFDGLRFRRFCGRGCPAPGDWSRPPQTLNDRPNGLTVSYPANWRRVPARPGELVAVSSGPPNPCALRAHDARFALSESAASPFGPPRPAGIGPVLRTRSFTCPGGRIRLKVHAITFADGGRSFRVRALVGRNVSASRRQVLDIMLRHLAFRRSFTDRERRVAGYLPRGWRRAGGTVFGSDIAFGTFRVDHRPTGACSPRWLARRPPGGAALLVLEYGRGPGPILPASPRKRRRLFPGDRPRARVALREPMRRYECFGLSRLVRWHERGRFLQAHLYIGRRTGGDSRRELIALFDSLRFRK